MSAIKHDGNFIYVSGISRADADRQNATWTKTHNAWRIPSSVHAMSELYQAIPQLRTDKTFMDLGSTLKRQFNRLLAIRSAGNRVNDGRLRLYQAQDVSYLLNLQCAGIFNEPRTGKTPTTITLMKHINGNKNLVVCPSSLQENWKREIESWWGVPAITLGGASKRTKQLAELPKQYVLIVSKNTLSKLKNLPVFDVAIVDEAHFLRNYKTTQSKATHAIKANRRYALTGTPTVSHSADIYGILKFLNPAKYPSYWQFVERYFTTYQGYARVEVGKPKRERLRELQENIGILSVQRKRKDVMEWLPDKEYRTLFVRMEGKQLKLYEDMKKTFVAELDSHEVDTPNILSQMMRLRQICIDPRLLGFDVEGAKTVAIKEFMESNQKEPLVIMSMFTSYLKILKSELGHGWRIGMITGEMTVAQKQDTVNKFQNGELDLLLCNTISAGTGFTLDKSQQVLFVDRAFTPADNEQAEDRVCPTSEERNHAHTIIDVVASKTVDERINKILLTKKTLTDFINVGGQQAIKSLLLGEHNT